MPVKAKPKLQSAIAPDLHCHSTFSVLDGIGKPEDIVKRAQELGWPAVSLTEHFFFIPAYFKDEIVSWTAIDEEDFYWLDQWNWQAHFTGKNYYIARQQWNKKPARIYMHRELLGLGYGDARFGDHIDGNTFDNRKCNLRILTRSLSNQNVAGHKHSTSRFRGVSFDRRTRKWEAYVKLNYRKIFLGYFADELEAARVAEKYRLEHMPAAVAR